MNIQNVKSIFFKILIGCLAAAATVAVIAVLVGSFNEVLGMALWTIVLVALHTLFSLAYVVSDSRGERDDLQVFTTVTFTLVIVSFITSVFAVWGVLGGELVARLYAFYFVLLFATLHGEVLAKTLGKKNNTDLLVGINLVFMAIVVFMLMGPIFVQDTEALGDVYYRILAAAGIVDATLTLIIVILNKLYEDKNHQPEAQLTGQVTMMQAPDGTMQQVLVQPPKRRMNIFVILLLIFVGGQLVLGLLGLIISVALSNSFS